MKDSQDKHPDSNQDSFFKTDHLKTNLKERSVRGGAVTVSSQVFKFVLQTGTTFILARFLAPQDFGLVGMVTVILVFVEFFKDLGLSMATVQKAEINHAQVNALFWINVAISGLTVAVIAALAPAVAWFYGEPRLIWITVALAFMFFLGGLTVQHRALLRRQMQFTKLAKTELISMTAGSVAAVLGAFLGAGYWSIVIWRVVRSVANLLSIWWFCRWRPGFPAWDASAKSMLVFGGNVTGFNLANYFSRNLDNILIGRYWGAQELGLYAVAYRVLLLPIQQINAPITAVALPTLSRLQKTPEKYKNYYYNALGLITTVGMPIVGFSFASADTLIPFLLGEQWVDTVPIFRLLAPAAFFGTFNVATGWAFNSLGRVDKQLYQGMVTAAINAITFLICVRWGAVGVAAGFGISRFFIRIPSIMYCYHGTPLTMGRLAKTLSVPIIASVSSALITLAAYQLWLQDVSLLVANAGELVLYIVSYLTIFAIIPGGKGNLLKLIETLNILLKRKSLSKA